MGKTQAVRPCSGYSQVHPTCVGKTTGACQPSAAHQVHPHVCGENSTTITRETTCTGTPPRVWGKPGANLSKLSLFRYTPRVWGKLMLSQSHRQTPRYTPTCVGKTRSQSQAITRTQVHPHVCGENVITNFSGYTYTGTPPRVWGKRCRDFPIAPPLLVHPHVCGENLF